MATTFEDIICFSDIMTIISEYLTPKNIINTYLAYKVSIPISISIIIYTKQQEVTYKIQCKCGSGERQEILIWLCKKCNMCMCHDCSINCSLCKTDVCKDCVIYCKDICCKYSDESDDYSDYYYYYYYDGRPNHTTHCDNSDGGSEDEGKCKDEYHCIDCVEKCDLCDYMTHKGLLYKCADCEIKLCFNHCSVEKNGLRYCIKCIGLCNHCEHKFYPKKDPSICFGCRKNLCEDCNYACDICNKALCVNCKKSNDTYCVCSFCPKCLMKCNKCKKIICEPCNYDDFGRSFGNYKKCEICSFILCNLCNLEGFKCYCN